MKQKMFSDQHPGSMRNTARRRRLRCPGVIPHWITLVHCVVSLPAAGATGLLAPPISGAHIAGLIPAGESHAIA